MQKLRCLVADDEPIARQIVETYINDAPNLELVVSCKNAFEVLEFLEKEALDVLFLDINMPKFSGISLIKAIQQKPAIIITTAYPEYAVEGFELAVTDYLLKPFSFERFLQAVFKIQKEKTSEKLADTTLDKGTEKMAVIPQSPEVEHSIFVKSDKRLIKLNFDDIQYIEAYGNYIKVYTDTMILTPLTLAEFLTKVPDTFIRVHKSFVINFEKIVMIEGNQITLQNNSTLPIGKLYKKAIMDKI